MIKAITTSAGFGAPALLAGLLLAGPVLADGAPSKGRMAAAPDHVDTRACGISGHVGLTTDNVFRGISLNNEDPAAQGALDLTCGMFYLGAAGSNVDIESTLKLDVYGGFRTTTGPVNWDIGFIYYAFTGGSEADDLNFVEFKLAASGEIWRGGTLGGTVFYAPDYFGQLGDAWTVQAGFSQALPQVGIFSPTFGAVIGRSYIDEDDKDYTFWNVGLTLGFRERWSLDLRYWDTDGDGLADSFGDRADERFVATVKYTF